MLKGGAQEAEAKLLPTLASDLRLSGSPSHRRLMLPFP